MLGPERGVRLVPEMILARKIIKKGNAPAVQVLIKWLNTAKEDSIWEDYSYIANNYPNLILRDKDSTKGGCQKLS
jgi:Chromo (CHRromatin Organisation MOdifier) domain